MLNPFKNRTPSLTGPGSDIAPVTPSDTVDFSEVAIALFVQTGGTISFVSARGTVRSVTVSDMSLLPVGVQRVNATGTSATGIHALLA